MEFLQSINWVGLILAVLGIIATYFGAPLAKKAQELVDACKYGKYAQMLYDTVDKIVKALYTTTVDELKKNSETGKLSDVDIAGLKESVSEMVKNDLADSAYKFLTEANSDFDKMVQDVVDAKIKEIKSGKVD